MSHAVSTGETLPKAGEIDVSRNDPSRGSAMFVVTRAQFQGGGTGSRPGDIWPDGWHVVAQRLSDDEAHDPEGERIQFYMTGSFTDMVSAEELAIVGKMTQRFVWTDAARRP